MKILATITLALALAAAPLTGATAADKTPGCVTKAEFTNVRMGQGIQAVQIRLGTDGRPVFESHKTAVDDDGNPVDHVVQVRDFRRCKSWHKAGRVGIKFTNYHYLYEAPDPGVYTDMKVYSKHQDVDNYFR